jgi:transposase
MANKPVSMLLLKRLLQLKEQGSSNRQIAGILHLTRNTVNAYMLRVNNCGRSNIELLLLNDESLSEVLLSTKTEPEKDSKYINFEQQLKYFTDQLKNKKTTKQILWEEYREQSPAGYSRSQFCELLKRYQDSRSAVMHFEHSPAELMEFDFAGDLLSYIDLQTGEIIRCPVLVCRLPCSGYTYIEVLQSLQRPYLIASLGRALQHFQGVPYMVRTDNMKQFVKKANRYEPSFDEYAQQWSQHYNTTLTATRVAKPRDKASVESSVNTAYYRVYAPLRNELFYSLAELNKAVFAKTEKLNHTKYQSRSYSRYDKFISLEQPLLRPLPDGSFVPKSTRSVKVAKNYHVMLGEDRHFYSVAHQYIGKQVSIVYDTENVEIYLNHQRIALHWRDTRKNAYTTIADHMPSNHRHYLEQRGWDEEYFLKRSAVIGENTVASIGEVLKQKTFIEQTYRSCMGIIRLADKYGNQRLDDACQRALSYKAKITYGALRNILEKNLDKQPMQTTMDFSLPEHDNLRGAGAYD